MKLKIVSDGTPQGTRVLTHQGEEVSNVTLVHWTCSSEGTTCLIELHGVETQLVGEATLYPDREVDAFDHIGLVPAPDETGAVDLPDNVISFTALRKTDGR